jgi:hypothetical protein
MEEGKGENVAASISPNHAADGTAQHQTELSTWLADYERQT